MNSSFDSRRGSGSIAGVDLSGPGRGALVERQRLQELLSGATTPLVLLAAPAGYGKSVLLAQWARLDPRPFASVTLTEAHNDPAILLGALIEALAPIEPLPDTVVSTIQAPQPNLDVVLPRLEAALRAREREMVLVLDELEHLSSESSLRLLEALLNGVERGLHVAMATRGAGPAHIGRLRAARRLTVLETADLVMTPGEARRLLAELGLEAPEEVDAIVAKAEGWPVALYLATLSRGPRPDRTLPDTGFGGEERNLVDYMRDEFLSTAPEEDVEFLVRISFLDRLSGELCDAVLGVGDSGSRLAALARENMLLIPLDRRDEWFRMHSLFADMLRGELRRRHGGELSQSRLRASSWWDAAGDPVRAVGFAIDGGDLARAGRLIWEAVPAFNTTGRHATIQRWIEEIGLERAAADAHLSLTVAHGFLAEGDGGAAEHWANVARRLLVSTLDPAVDLRAGLAMIDATLARGGTAAMAAGAALAVDSLPGEGPWSSMANLMAGMAAHFGGETERARSELSDAARRAAVWHVPLIQVLALAQLALLAAAEEDWQSARILASQARAQIDRSGLISRPSIALSVAISAYVSAVDHRDEDARADLSAGRDLLRRLDGFGAWFEVETAAALAAAAVELNDPAAASELLQLARSRLADLPDAPILDAWVTSIGEGAEGLSPGAAAELTPAELRVLRLLPSHLSIRQIAAELNVSQNTVKTQVRAAYRKLGVSSRHEAVELCRQLGLVPADDKFAGRAELPTSDR
ncbi:MAG: LuxR C-terminal-related transcriptional regulator [Solirubrobacterales bacterium]